MFLRSFALLLAAVLLSLLWAQAAVAQQSPGITVSVNEVVSTSDGPKVLPPAVVSIDESVHVGDAPTVLPPTVVDITESIVATDQPVPVLPFTGCPAAHTSYDFTVANSPFTLTCSLQVDVGQSLTIDPGVQVRMPDGARIDIFGTANINGTPAAPVSIISAVAADPGRWAGVLVRAGSNVQMTSTTIESAGNSYARSLWLFDGATPSLAAITIRQSLGSGIYYEDGAAGSLAGATVDTTTGPGVVLAGRGCPQITNLTVNNAADYGIELSSIACDPDLTGLQLSHNGHADHILLSGGELRGGRRILRQRAHTYDVQGSIQVDADATLMTEPNVVMGMQDGARLDVSGGFDATAGGLQLISAAGNEPGHWEGLLIRAGSQVAVTGAVIESAGRDFGRAVWVFDGATPALSNVSIRQTAGTGIYYEGAGAGSLTGSAVDTTTGPGVVLAASGCPSITRTSISNTGGYGIQLSSLACDPDLSGLQLSNDGNANHISLNGGELGGGTNRTLRQRGYVYDLQGSILVDSGASLSFEPDLTLMMQSRLLLDVHGTLDASSGGLQLLPASGTQPGAWDGLVVRGGSSVTMSRASLSSAGGEFGRSVWIFDGAAPSFNQLKVSNTLGDGFYYEGFGAGSLIDTSVDGATGAGLNLSGFGCPAVTRLSVANTVDYAVRLASLTCDPGLSGLSLTNDGASNRIALNGGELRPGSDRTLHSLGYDYDVYGSIAVDQVASLVLEPGTTLRFQDGALLDVYGTLNASGTGAAPIAFVSAVATEPNHWAGIVARGGSNVVLRNAIVSSAGNNFGRAIWIFDGAQPTLDFVNILGNYGTGVYSESSLPQLITHANIVGNTSYGVFNAGSAEMDARNNWWGSPTGPSNPLLNDGGLGDNVSDNVLFIPWAGETVLPPLTISVPPDLNVPTDAGLASATVNPGLASTTGTSVVGTRSDSLGLNAPYPLGVTTITWQATDLYNQHASGIQTITVVDREPPIITAPPDVTVTAAPGGTKAAVSVGQATATDNVPGVNVTGTRSDGLTLNALFPIGSTSITWTATDTSGNTATAVQHITVHLDPNTALLPLTPGQAGLMPLPSGQGSLAFPPDLVNTPSLVVLLELPVIPHPVQQGTAFAGLAYSLDVTEISTGAPLHQFGTTYTASFGYSDSVLQSAGIPSATSLRFASWNGSAWQSEPSQVDVANHVVVGTFNHASEWALLGDTTTPVCTDPDCIPGGPPPEPGSTPELDSLLLFAPGAASLLIALIRRRRRAQ